MGIEQNLEEMILSLQRSVDDLGSGGEAVPEGSEDLADISTSDLQRKLEEKYFTQGASGTHVSDGSYELDDDVLAQFFADGDEEISDGETLSEELPSAEGVAVATLAEELPEAPFLEAETEDNGLYDGESLDGLDLLTDGDEAFRNEDFIEETVDAEEIIDIEEAADIENELDDRAMLEAAEEAEAQSELEALDAFEDVDEYDDVDGEYEEIDVIEGQTDIDCDDAESAAEPEETEAEPAAENEAENRAVEFDPYAPQAPVEKNISFKALMRDYGRPDPIPSSKLRELEETEEDGAPEYETSDVGDIFSDFADDTPTRQDEINSEVRRLMTSLGCEDELSDLSAEAIGEIYGQFGGEEEQRERSVSSEAVIEEKRSEYRRGIIYSALKLSACALLTFIMFLYDALPMIGVDFIGLADYSSYPGAYVMIGTQLLLICAAVMWSDMWKGIKGLLTVYPNIYSMATVVVCSCVFYDAVFFITASYNPLETPTFHFLCGAFLTVVCVYSLIMKARESATYDLYSADVAKFTLTRDGSVNSVAEKMYSGGFSKDKKVYLPSNLSEPRGFFDAISDGGSFGNAAFSSLILMSVGVGIIFGIILMIVKGSVEEGAVAAMSAIMALTPVSAVAATFIPMAASHLRLKKRGIALTGRKMIRRYGANNALVFSDLHLFSKCDPKQIGFVCYEKMQTKSVLAALNILYSRIGGPMGEVFANIPEDYLAKSIRIRRITRSGIEAVVDKSHVLLVGDMSFMRRYGIEYPTVSARAQNDTVYVSLDGRATARLTAVYKVEPVFDMLIERLSAEGVHCVIETYDPMINTAFVASRRRCGRAPVSVVHKNAADINSAVDNTKKRSDHGLLVLSSRLKLAEAVVWCARLCRIEKLLNVTTYVSIGVGFVAVALLGALGVIPCMIQYLLFAYTLLTVALVAALTLARLPEKKYFTAEALAEEDCARDEEQKRKEERKIANEQKRK